MKLAEKALTSPPLASTEADSSQIVSFFNLQVNATTIVEEE
jgi:hypothetical protein